MRAKLRLTAKAAPLELPWVAAALLAGSPAVALQPLDVFIAAAREHNPDAQQARANLAEQNAQADVSLGRQLPGVSVRGTYDRNQYQVQLTVPTTPAQTFLIQPRDQWIGTATLTVPLVDLAGFRRITAARTNAESYERTLAATRLAVEGQTVQDYYQLLANVALVATAAAAATRAAQQQADAQKLALLPTIAGSFTEFATNAPGFEPKDWYYQASVYATWAFDLTYVANIRTTDASAGAARARELKARLNAGDAINRYWNTVLADIAQSRSARAGRDASVHAAEQARAQYQAGTATQLDLLQAQRDAFRAEVTRIQDDANLLNARAQLRLSAGQSLLR